MVSALHLLFIVYVVFGAALLWRWPRSVWLHLPAALWGVFVELSDTVCPLTPLDSRLRQTVFDEPLELQSVAYFDGPLPIGFGKTISQPFIVAVMTDLLDLRPSDIVLEIGTGLGYQTAVLAHLAQRVYSVELIEELAVQARRRLAQQAYTNIEIRVGNGCAGWPEQAPFDRIIVTAAPELIPVALLDQLAPGGRMVVPAGQLPSKGVSLSARLSARLLRAPFALFIASRAVSAILLSCGPAVAHVSPRAQRSGGA